MNITGHPREKIIAMRMAELRALDNVTLSPFDVRRQVHRVVKAFTKYWNLTDRLAKYRDDELLTALAVIRSNFYMLAAAKHGLMPNGIPEYFALDDFEEAVRLASRFYVRDVIDAFYKSLNISDISCYALLSDTELDLFIEAVADEQAAGNLI